MHRNIPAAGRKILLQHRKEQIKGGMTAGYNVNVRKMNMKRLQLRSKGISERRPADTRIRSCEEDRTKLRVCFPVSDAPLMGCNRKVSSILHDDRKVRMMAN